MNSGARVAATAAVGNIGSCFLRALFFSPACPISCNYPHWEADRRTWMKKGLNVRSHGCKMYFLAAEPGRWWEMNVCCTWGNGQQQQDNKRERRSGGQRQRGWNFTTRYLTSAGTQLAAPHQTPARSKVKGQKVRYHIKFTLSMLCYSPCSACG